MLKSFDISSMDVETFNSIKAKADRMIMAIAKNYISDGYHFGSYEYKEDLGYIEINLNNINNKIKITSMLIDKEIIVYKNNKINNSIKISA